MIIDLGRATPIYRGAYNESVEYEVNDLVRYSNALWWHKSATKTTGVTPAEGSTWSLVALDGPNSVNSTTETSLTGILRGNGSTVEVQVVDNIPTEGSTNPVASGGTYTELSKKLNLSGGAMSGTIAMGGNKVTGLAPGTNNNDAVNLEQMNEAINSASANYKGGYASRATLLAIAWQDTNPAAANFVTNNDYAYVESDETHDSEAWRYIYVKAGSATGTWSAAYRINEAPLSTAQMAAIDSGITATLVTQIDTNTSDINGIKNGANINSFGAVENALNSKQNTLTFDSVPTANSTNPVTSGGIKTYVDTAVTNSIQNAIGGSY